MPRRWPTLNEMRDRYAASGLELAKRHPECRGKVRYGSEPDADLGLASLSGSHDEHPARARRLTTYGCRWCGGWHVGHDGLGRTRRGRRRRKDGSRDMAMKERQQPTRPQGRTEVIDADESERDLGSSAGPLEQIARGEVDIQIATARRFPRSIEAFQKKALSMATIDEETAASCFYVLPKRKGAEKAIEGPSARLAEIVAAAYGHMAIAGRIVEEGDRFVVAQGAAWDLENNVRRVVEVRRRITTRDGGRFSDDMIAVTCNAAIAIATRNAVFQVIPQAYTRQIYHACREVAVGTQQTLTKRRGLMLEHFQKMGIEPGRVFALLEVRGVEDITLEHMATLRGLATAIKEGDTSIDDAFPPAGTARGNDPVVDLLGALQPETRAQVVELFTQLGMNRGQQLVQLRSLGTMPDKLIEVLQGMLGALKAEEEGTAGEQVSREVPPSSQQATSFSSSAPSSSSPASTPSTTPATSAKPTAVPKQGKYDF